MADLPKIAVLGSDGFIGRHLHAAVTAVHGDAVGTSRDRNSSKPFLDVADPECDFTWLAESGHTHAVISFARANIMYCEAFPKAAAQINIEATLRVLRGLTESGIVPVFYSTDYVFGDGPDIVHSETDAPCPATVYGRQKLEIEQRLGELNPRALILRLGKVYGLEKSDGTLFDDMAARLLRQRSVDPPVDQSFNPTWVGDVVAGTLSLVASASEGVFHLCAEPYAWRRQLGLEMAGRLGCDPSLVPEPVEAPLHMALSSEKFRTRTGQALVSPMDALERVAKSYLVS